ncbi:hypothetical protein K402DRAFT_390685 [Aulographum hederae CBS 113979]|uniref:PX domain-containing protein n=1 Tax=Aulographum hederae CBS 113979 TaxID=1176131 RepID=A0A6G1H9U1_9PEZI|nr:hypothetical protein K402DRAFT_390685 [Aulographum hederae CBS 113979]
MAQNVEANTNQGPAVKRSEDEVPTVEIDAPKDFGEPAEGAGANPARIAYNRSPTNASYMSIPPPGSILTGKQEHYLKRELISQQTKYEISELASPTALQRFGAPFKSDVGEVAPEDSELPILRYLFVHHVRNFPFLDHAREKEFWQDKLQVFLESFANKHISSSEDRLEETKRKKLAVKAEKLMELMMVSGLPTASGYEERIRFSEMEVVDRGANEKGLIANAPQGQEINGWDINIAGVRTTSVKRHLRYHQHAEYLLRVKKRDEPEIYVGRRFGEFAQMRKRLRIEMAGKVLPPLPRKNKNNSMFPAAEDDDADSISSVSTTQESLKESTTPGTSSGGYLRSYLPSFGSAGHKRSQSAASAHQSSSPRPSMEGGARPAHHVLYREEQRVSLRAFLRNLLHNEHIAQSATIKDFLTRDPIVLNEEEMEDVEKREDMDEKRMEEQKQFYEIARKRAAELDIHMEKFRREIVEANGLRKLFQEIKVKSTIGELRPETQKFAEWLRIEVAATIYHLFLAEDNSPELFAQLKRIHSMVPYTMLKNVIRVANPAAVMSGVLDLFLVQPFGAKSLMQRIFGMAISDGIRQLQKQIDTLTGKISDKVLASKIAHFTSADEELKASIRRESEVEQVDVVVAVLRSDQIEPELTPEQVGKVFNAYVAWNNAVENVDDEMRQGAVLFAQLKQLLKLHMRQRDKTMMLQIIEEPTTLQLFRDLFTIFYEPLVRVYKSANVYNSITDFAVFVDDTIKTVESAQRQDVSADPNQTVQAFIDLCARHEHNLYKFIHEVHLHDNGLFDQLMGWIEGVLDFLRKGPKGGKLDMNALFQGGVDSGIIDKAEAVKEINHLIKWQMARKKWHQDKTRQKMAADGKEGDAPGAGLGMTAFKSSDFGLNELDLADLELDDNDDDEDEEEALDEEDEDDPIAAERKRRLKQQAALKRSAGEPKKPEVNELGKMMDGFMSMLRSVLAE